ncbi:MAG: preprotein translocase subunit SecE [Gammaproteobacteria bacterium]|nr:preprotein translocase subunit SecE [Gammaproteobacteria bacterium]MDH5777795.1 preprotein translocase subunit SecE [Gammaproteobacteria bacterium]
MADKIKLLIAVALIAAGVVGFYHYADQAALLYRVLGLLAVIAVSFAVALTTQTGMNTLNFGRSAVLEVRRSVWPTRKETTQTTLLVIVMVFIIGLMLWLFDMVLLWGVKMLTGQGG